MKDGEVYFRRKMGDRGDRRVAGGGSPKDASVTGG